MSDRRLQLKSIRRRLPHGRWLVNLVLLLAFDVQALAGTLPVAAPEAVGMSTARLARMDGEIASAIAKHETPGVVVLVARKGRVVWRKAYGSRAILPAREEMTADTIFDMASLTKVIATATSIMILIERGRVRLSDPVSVYIPELKGGGREHVTIEHLLTHRAGYAPDFDLGEKWSSYDSAMQRLSTEPLRSSPGERFRYSDIGYIALGEVVRKASGLPLDEFASRNIFQPLGMRDTVFRPSADLIPRIAPTETKAATAAYLGGRAAPTAPNSQSWLRGQVHDPTAYRMGGVAGHAGLFSTADDLAIYCQMILNKGEYDGVRILSPMGVALMTRPRPVSNEGDVRGLGWDVATGFSSNRGDVFPPGSFGHTGFTGTSVWIDPASQTSVIFLSNRVHPDGKGDVGPLRGRIASIVASSITDTTLTASSNNEGIGFAMEVLTSLARVQAERGMTAVNRNSDTATSGDADVLTGVDVLEREGFKELSGMRIGLVTNHTGRDRRGQSTIDVLRTAEGVRLVALFSPEHGIRGVADQKLSDSHDEATGLPVFSLYGESRRPKPEQLKDLDAIVFDIQDVGARFYTYISTLGYVMEEAAQRKLPVFVLDRPNPIGGVEVEGPIADADKFSFTAYDAIPIRHGMTIGELARLFNDDRRLKCDLHVIKMENWRRTMWYDSTGLVWVNPSPNMRSLTEALLYPGVGLLETTNISVGRGTDTPFEVIGAPWLDGRRLAARLNGRGLAGVRFVPIRFTPSASVFKGEECGGVNLIVTNRAQFHPVLTGLEIALALRNLYPSAWRVDDYGRLLANSDALEHIKRGDTSEEAERSSSPSIEKFRSTRERALLYK